MPNSATSPQLPGAYRDRKRYAWLLSLLTPILIGSGPALMSINGNVAMLWLPIALMYLVLPSIDWLLGEDSSNPPESEVPRLNADKYYRYITFLLVPILWVELIWAAWFVTQTPLPWHGVFALIISTGAIGGFCINVGHEMGHKNEALERWLAKFILAPTGYGHFSIEHNRGHHRDVATPLDSASSRMGEGLYSFMMREMPGAFRRAWGLERDRLVRAGQPVWSLHNEILQPALITLTFWSVLTLWLGWTVLPFLLAISFWANFQLTIANYIEHYGLLRAELSPGRYEPCQPHHSWNSNHIVSNWATFHLQRHSDHHAHPLRRYQSLRHFDGLPELPNGYFGMFVVAYVPALWFRVMDHRLLAAVGHDMRRINFDPAQRERLIAKYHLALPTRAQAPSPLNQ